MPANEFLAFDLGAESGRAVVVTLNDGKCDMRSIHRFPNRPVRMGGCLYWDLPYLYTEVLAGMKLAAEAGAKPLSMGIDTWGVDFGLLDSAGHLLGNPVHYRDSRTAGIHEHSGRTMSLAEIFSLTALHTLPFNTLFQLAVMKKHKSPLLDCAGTLLMMPDLINYFLTGKRTAELSIAQTSQLVGTDCKWCGPIIERFGLSPGLFPPLVEPGTVLGAPLADVCHATGLGDTPVIATTSHDTSSAVAAVPGEGDNWAFLSCGTWSILGRMENAPQPSRECHEAGFTYEYTLGGWYLGRNILGLWLVQELRRKWNTASDPWDYTRMTEGALAAESGPLLNAEDASLLVPADMERALLALIAKAGCQAPTSRGQLVRAVLESLALAYAKGIDTIGQLTGRRPTAIYMVGGGAANTLLCQLTASACGVPVYAGANECTALGNALVQAVGMGVLGGPADIRQVMRNSFAMAEYTPQDQTLWEDKRAAYARLTGSAE